MGSQPVPINFGAAQAMGPDGKVWVLLTFATVVGTSTYWFPPEVLEGVAKAVTTLAAAGQLLLAPPARPGGL